MFKYDTKTGEIKTKVVYPKYAQPKMNGVRSFVSLELKETGEGLFKSKDILPVFRSRDGREYDAPQELIKQFKKLFDYLKSINYDVDNLIIICII